MKKLKNIVIWTVILYVAAFAISFATTDIIGSGAAKEFVEHLSSTTTLVIAGVGLLAVILYMVVGKVNLSNDKEGYVGKTQSGEEMGQHYDARFVTEKELLTNPTFMPTTFHDLPKVKKTGVMLRSLYKNGKMHVNMYNPIHTLIIGTTGSGKTTFVLEPAIRVYAHSAEKPCMVITDPKGELYNNHSIQLREEGYRLMVIDLRNPYASSRWNPMENAFNMYHKAHNLEQEVKVYSGAHPSTTKFKVISDKYENTWYGFNGIAYPNKEHLLQDMEAKKQSLINEAENELREICSTIVTIESKTDQGWERGAQDFLY
ncbi:MAG: type IV secretory system conjugative DNA transfer family protein, partial [Methanobrevibacter sp.]|nr:type IV secretory system conjugative DNA transfer family protein [Methanobrevibacter sp.]